MVRPLFAWGVSYGMTGEPTFYDNHVVGGVGVAFAIVGTIASATLWED